MSGEGYASGLRIIITLTESEFEKLETKNKDFLIHVKLPIMTQFTKCFEKYSSMKLSVGEKSNTLDICAEDDSSWDKVKLKWEF